MNTWDLPEAIDLCCKIEAVCPALGFHVAMTGGLLYKGGVARKDLDLVFYRIRHIKDSDPKKVMEAMKPLGVEQYAGGGWRYVGNYQGKVVDFLFPEF